MKDSTNEFSDEERARILLKAADLLNLIQNASVNDFACGINKGLEKQSGAREILSGKVFNEGQEIKSLAEHIDDSLYFNAIKQAYKSFLPTQVNSNRYILKGTDWVYTDPLTQVAFVSIEPKLPTFFQSKVGPINEVEIFALNVIVKVTHSESKTTIEIISHFNPETFRNVRIEYLGVINTGTNRHFYKNFLADDNSTPENVKILIIEKLNEAISFYFKKDIE